MSKMKVASLGVKFNPEEACNEVSLKLPQDTEILSVSTKSDEDVLWFTYMSSVKSYQLEVWQEFHFVIVKCEYIEFDFDVHKYIGNISIGDTIYAVFYKKGALEN